MISDNQKIDVTLLAHFSAKIDLEKNEKNRRNLLSPFNFQRNTQDTCGHTPSFGLPLANVILPDVSPYLKACFWPSAGRRQETRGPRRLHLAA